MTPPRSSPPSGRSALAVAVAVALAVVVGATPASTASTASAARSPSPASAGVTVGGTGAVAAPSIPAPMPVPVPAPDGRWLSPLEGALIVSGPYLPPPTPYASGHRGVDLPAGPGTSVRAPEGGTVTFVGEVVDRGAITIRVDEATVYSVEPVTSQLSAGDNVPRGGALGVVATGGHCEAECTHLGVRVDDEYVSPLRFLLGTPILLPW